MQLSILSLKALNDNPLVFSYDDLEEICPDIVATQGITNGLGLLQAIEHYNLTKKVMTFHFLCLTVHECLAAHCIIHYFPPKEELLYLCEIFWIDLHASMFLMYIPLIKRQGPSFKHFLCGDDKITIFDEFFINQLK